MGFPEDKPSHLFDPYIGAHFMAETPISQRLNIVSSVAVFKLPEGTHVHVLYENIILGISF